MNAASELVQKKHIGNENNRPRSKNMRDGMEQLQKGYERLRDVYGPPLRTPARTAVIATDPG